MPGKSAKSAKPPQEVNWSGVERLQPGDKLNLELCGVRVVDTAELCLLHQASICGSGAAPSRACSNSRGNVILATNE